MIKIQRIGLGYQGKASVLERLKSTIFGKFYLKRLRKVPVVRALVIFSWAYLLRAILYVYAKFHLVSLKSISKAADNVRVVYKKERVLTPVPKIYPTEKTDVIPSHLDYEFPEISIADLKNYTVLGSSNFIHNQYVAVHHDLFRPSHDYTSEELHGRYYIEQKKSSIARFLNIKTANTIANGVLFTDAVSGNYAHFLTEVLPRIYVYTQENPHSAAAYIIDIGLHVNLMQALEVIIGNNAEVIGLESGEPLNVESLQVVSPCGYVPFERRPSAKKQAGHSDGMFSPSALLSMREKIINKVSQIVVAHQADTNQPITNQPRKILIRRNSVYRNINNSKEIEALLLTKGFVIVEPEKLSFYEQVVLFSNAEVIIGATGAALANLIFCNANTKIIILIAEFEHMIYGYWQNMACAVGNKITYVIGESTDIKAQLHSDFRVSVQDLLEAISE